MLRLRAILETFSTRANILIYADYPQNPYIKPRVVGNHYAERWIRSLNALQVDYPVEHYNLKDDNTWVLLIECPDQRSWEQLTVAGNRLYEDIDGLEVIE